MNNTNKPTIRVLVSEEVQKREYRDMLLGIEEEGVPFEIEESNLLEDIELSYIAATQSRLGVGIGISSKYISLHYEKLPQDKPLFRINKESSEEALRAIGSNAARLVKRMPFKGI